MANNDINIKVQVDTTQAEKSTVNYRKRVRELKDEMTSLQLAGKENTSAYAAAAAELGTISDAMSDTSAQARILSDDFFKQRAAMEGLSLGVNVFSGLTQAAALCGVENEDLQEVLVKLQAAQNLANVAMNISKALNKDTALMTALRAKSTKASTNELNKETSALGKGTVAMGAYTTGEGVATTGAITLTGAVKAVGIAIKSIPVIGWILAAISAIITLISLIADANEEEEEGVRIKERENQEIQKIRDHHKSILDDLRSQNKELQDQLANLSQLSKDSIEYKDTMEALTEQTKLSQKYLESLTDEAKGSVSVVYSKLKEEETQLNNLMDIAAEYQKQLEEAKEKRYSEDEEEREKAFKDEIRLTAAIQGNQQEIDKQNASIKDRKKAIDKERQKEIDWQKKQSEEVERQKRAQEYAKKQTQEKEEAEKRYQELLKTTLSELTELNDVLYPKDEEEKLTEKYDRLLDLSIKYYGEESEQVALLTKRRLEALNELTKATLEAEQKTAEAEQKAAKEREREAVDEGYRIAKAEVEGKLLGLTEGSEEYYEALESQYSFEYNLAMENLNRQHIDGLMSEEEYNAQKLLLAQQLEANITALQQEEEQKRFDLRMSNAEQMVSLLSNLTTAMMDAELAAVGDNEKEQAKVRKKYAKMNFLSQIASIGIDTAKGIMSVWATAGQLGPIAGPIAGAIQTALIAAMGIAQTAKAKAAMNKALSGKAARGAFITGRSHSEGGELWELEGGEAVLNKRAMAIPAFRQLASAMNESTGGVSFTGIAGGISRSSTPTISAGVSEETIQKIVTDTVAGVTSIPVVVTEHHITETQRRVGVINSQASF